MNWTISSGKNNNMRSWYNTNTCAWVCHSHRVLTATRFAFTLDLDAEKTAILITLLSLSLLLAWSTAAHPFTADGGGVDVRWCSCLCTLFAPKHYVVCIDMKHFVRSLSSSTSYASSALLLLFVSSLRCVRIFFVCISALCSLFGGSVRVRSCILFTLQSVAHIFCERRNYTPNIYQFKYIKKIKMAVNL